MRKERDYSTVPPTPQSLIKACIHNGTSSIFSGLSFPRVPTLLISFSITTNISQTRDRNTSRLQLPIASMLYGTSTSIPDGCTALAPCAQPQVVELISPTIPCGCPAILLTIIVPAQYSSNALHQVVHLGLRLWQVVIRSRTSNNRYSYGGYSVGDDYFESQMCYDREDRWSQLQH